MWFFWNIGYQVLSMSVKRSNLVIKDHRLHQRVGQVFLMDQYEEV